MTSSSCNADRMTELKAIETDGGLGYEVELDAAPADVWRLAEAVTAGS